MFSIATVSDGEGRRVVVSVWRYDETGNYFLGEVGKALEGRVDVLWLPFLERELFGVVNKILSSSFLPLSLGLGKVPLFLSFFSFSYLLNPDTLPSHFHSICRTPLKKNTNNNQC